MNINDSTVVRSFTHLAMFKVILVMLIVELESVQREE